MANTREDIMRQAQKDYTEFCDLFNGRPHNEIPSIVDEYGLDYGALEYGDDETDGVVDINFKSICATVYKDEDELCRVNLQCEIYDENGQPFTDYPLGEL